MNAFEFIQWCFRDERSASYTIIVGILLAMGLRYVAEGFRGGSK